MCSYFPEQLKKVKRKKENVPVCYKSHVTTYWKSNSLTTDYIFIVQEAFNKTSQRLAFIECVKPGYDWVFIQKPMWTTQYNPELKEKINLKNVNWNWIYVFKVWNCIYLKNSGHTVAFAESRPGFEHWTKNRQWWGCSAPLKLWS